MTCSSPPPMNRRRFLALAGLGLAACAGGTTSAPPAPQPSRSIARRAAPRATPSAAPTPTPTPRPSPTRPPHPPPFEPLAEDMLPNAKRLASRVVQALTTYDPGASADAIATAALSVHEAAQSGPPLAAAADLATVAASLVHPDAWSRGEIVYPQLGGETSDACSVMVVIRQISAVDGDTPAATTRTIDVRLRLVDGAWALESIASLGGDPPEEPGEPTPAAQAVLEDPRIDLPDSARWDILAGGIDERLLVTMREMADLAPYAVTTLRSGHPHNVFGKSHVSNHTRGRAVDVWNVDGAPVVTQQPHTDSAAHAMLRTLFDRGVVSELGGPWAFDGYGGRSFTDAHVHKDHLHVAFS